MSLYQRMYYRLFNRVTDAVEALRRGESAAALAGLIAAQQETEELYISADAAAQAEPET